MRGTMTDFVQLREQMVDRQIAGRGIDEPRILAAFRSVPRERFVPDELRHCAYDDHPLAIEAGQTISQPYIVAVMIQAAAIAPQDRVLEVGAGSGYAAALLGKVAASVVAIERHGELARLAAGRLAALGQDNVRVVEGDGSLGFPEEAPYDAILCSASGSHVPQALIEQLAAGGRLVMPVGDPESTQDLVRVVRNADGRISREIMSQVRFVPLVGEQGWKA